MRRLLVLCLLAAVGPAAAQSLTVVVGRDSVVLGRSALEALPADTAVVRIHDGPERAYVGPRLAAVLAAAGAMADRLHGADLGRTAVVEAADGYRVAFGLGELAPGLGASPALLALRVDGAALPAEEGPLRLVVPGDGRPARWARQVVRVVVSPGTE